MAMLEVELGGDSDRAKIGNKNSSNAALPLLLDQTLYKQYLPQIPPKASLFTCFARSLFYTPIAWVPAFPFGTLELARVEFRRKLCPSRLRRTPSFSLYNGPRTTACDSDHMLQIQFRIHQSANLLLILQIHGVAMEPMDIVGRTKEDASLPKATMTKIIKEMLPPDVRVARDAQDLIIECCVEFINLISSESNEVCGREERRTIAPEHVLKALQDLGFGEYIEEVYAAYEQHKLETVDAVRTGKLSNVAEMTEEQALVEQQRMFAEARARMNGGIAVPKQPEPLPQGPQPPQPSLNT
ncbi:Dr1 homolog [Olea europaea subsp. europaea]|uniref:Dr1 homolog n=1 Tax=Olea europaea subsp. europaea TaxID=158383 RepID=A0A8S0UYD7_OLEEU|nr:Dr1 homolog [Olea europaea subsp. europaea]